MELLAKKDVVEIVTKMLWGSGVIVLAGGIISAPYIIGHCIIGLVSSGERKYGHGARWFMGSATIFLAAASYWIGDTVTF